MGAPEADPAVEAKEIVCPGQSAHQIASGITELMLYYGVSIPSMEPYQTLVIVDN